MPLEPYVALCPPPPYTFTMWGKKKINGPNQVLAGPVTGCALRNQGSLDATILPNAMVSSPVHAALVVLCIGPMYTK